MTGVRRVSPLEAHRLIDDGWAYLDVRTPEEFSEGHPEGAINVSFESRTNPVACEAFVSRVRALFAVEAKICVGCKSGIRSLEAAEVLVAAGFSNVVDQRAGWDGARGDFGELLEPGWKRLALP
jgi:rhodanese-related sulfurtransferase